MENNKKNIILVPTDFSDVAGHALDHAISVAKTFDNEIAVVHVVEENVLGNIFTKSSYADMVKESIQNKLNGIALKIESTGIKAYTHIRSGRIYKAIVEAADELGCDSIIMGTHGASGIEKIIGSNAARVINYADVPVIVIKEKSNRLNYENIVFPLDLTIESKQKVAWAIHLAKYYKSTIHIATFKANDEFLANRVNAQLVQVERLFDEAKVKYASKILDESGNYAKQTMEYANEINADLIMIMTQQDKGVSEFFLGSYAQQIVNNATSCPVMAINPRETAFVSDYMA